MARRRKRIAVSIVILAFVLMAGCVWAAIKLTHSSAAELGHARLLCQKQDQLVHHIGINGFPFRGQTSFRECDIISLTNTTSTPLSVEIESNGKVVSYDGLTQTVLPPHVRINLTLVKPGIFEIVDTRSNHVLLPFRVTAR